MAARSPSDSQIVDTVVRKLVPFILLFGLYLVSYGHISPGGGFQGGVVIATAALVLALSRGVEPTRRVFPRSALVAVQVGSFFLFLLLASLGLASGVGFLGNFLPVGHESDGAVFSMVFFFDLAIGLEVSSGVTLVLLALLESSEPDHAF